MEAEQAFLLLMRKSHDLFIEKLKTSYNIKIVKDGCFCGETGQVATSIDFDPEDISSTTPEEVSDKIFNDLSEKLSKEGINIGGDLVLRNWPDFWDDPYIRKIYKFGFYTWIDYAILEKSP